MPSPLSGDSVGVADACGEEVAGVTGVASAEGAGVAGVAVGVACVAGGAAQLLIAIVKHNNKAIKISFCVDFIIVPLSILPT